MTQAHSSKELIIERAQRQDVPALAELGAKTFTDKFGHLYSAENLSRFLTESHSQAAYEALLSDADTALWVSRDSDGTLAAYAVAARGTSLPIDGDASAAMEIKRLYVDQAYQGAGLGRQLMDVMLAWISEAGDRPIYLSVYKYNDGAQRFYQRYGFSEVREITFLVGDHVDPELLYGRPNSAGSF